MGAGTTEAAESTSATVVDTSQQRTSSVPKKVPGQTREKLDEAVRKAREKLKREKEGKGGSGADATPQQPSGPAPTTGGSLPNEGTKAVAPGVPTKKGADNSVQSFGVEAPGGARIDAALVGQAYLAALVARSWSEACGYLSRKTRGKVIAVGALFGGKRGRRLPLGGAGVGHRGAAGVDPSGSDIDVLSFRVRGSDGFLIYRDATGDSQYLLMARTGSAWDVAALGGKPLIR